MSESPPNAVAALLSAGLRCVPLNRFYSTGVQLKLIPINARRRRLAHRAGGSRRHHGDVILGMAKDLVCTATAHPCLRKLLQFGNLRRSTFSEPETAPSSQRLDIAKDRYSQRRAVNERQAFFMNCLFNVYTSQRIALGKPPPFAEGKTGDAVDEDRAEKNRCRRT